MMDPNVENRSIGHLLRDLADQTRKLFRQEVQLAKAELTETATATLRNSLYVVIGGVVALVAALCLIAALVVGLAMALAQIMPPEIAYWLSPLIVAIVFGIVGYVLIHKGIQNLRHQRMAPRQTTQTIQEDVQWLKAKLTT